MSLRVACKYAYTAYIVSNIIHSIIPIDWSVFTAVRPESVLTSALSSGGTCSRTRRDSARSDQLDRVGSRRLAEVDERQEEQAVASWQIKSCSIFCSRIQHEFCISTANNLKQVFASQISTYLNHASDFFWLHFLWTHFPFCHFPLPVTMLEHGPQDRFQRKLTAAWTKKSRSSRSTAGFNESVVFPYNFSLFGLDCWVLTDLEWFFNRLGHVLPFGLIWGQLHSQLLATPAAKKQVASNVTKLQSLQKFNCFGSQCLTCFSVLSFNLMFWH